MIGAKCWLTRRKLIEYVDGELSAAARQSVDAHIGACARCRGELAAHQAEMQLANQLELSSPSVDFTARVMAHIAAQPVSVHPARPHPRSLSLSRVGWVATAAATIAVAVTFYTRLPHHIPVTVPERSSAIVNNTLPNTTALPPGIAKGSGTVAPDTGVQIAQQNPPKLYVPVGANSVRNNPKRTGAHNVTLAKKSTTAVTQPKTTTAEPSATTVLDSDPYAVATRHEKEGQLDDALEAYTAAAEDKNNYVAAVVGAGSVYERMNLPGEALDAYEALLDSDQTTSAPSANGTGSEG
jgi:hypothetical protein